MKEIEFRGKSKFKNTWVYGKLLNHKRIITQSDDETEEKSCFDMCDYQEEVYENTIGQYTGLKDKNGKRIFEGDVVKLRDEKYCIEWTAVVEFGNPNGEYVWGWNLRPMKKLEINTDILCWVEMEDGGAFCEVIGNIYDNPELLKGE